MGAIPSALTLNYDAILSTTIFKWADTLADAISTANAFYYQLIKGTGYQEVGDIGDRLQLPLMYELGNADSYSGYDILDVTPADGISSAFYNWGQAAVSISISGLEEKKNRGEERMINLLQAKTDQARMGLITFFDKALLQGNGINSATSVTTAYSSPLNGSTFIDPIGLQVIYDPTSSTTIGNINQSTNTWWRNQTTTSAASTYAGFLKEARKTRNNASKGPGGTPDLHLSDQSTYELYEAALANSHRNPSYQKADIPFDNIAFFGDPLTWDEYVVNAADGTTVQSTTKGTWYMFNTKFWSIRVDEETNFAAGPFIRPENQDARTSQILWLGAVGCSNRRKQAVMGHVDTTIAA